MDFKNSILPRTDAAIPFIRRFVPAVLILSTLFATHLNGQTILSGHVTDSETGTPVPDTEIYTISTGDSRHTDQQGFFEIRLPSEGNITLFFFSLGFEIMSRPVTLAGDSLTLEINLEKLSGEMTQVTVTEQRERLFSIRQLREVDGTAIYAGKKNDVIQLERLTANTAANNARQIYGQVAGLNIYESNDAGLQLNIGGRGLDPSRTSNFNTRQNGYDISADVLGYPESYYTPPAEALDEIQIIRGAASLQYGTQFGGLVNFHMKKPDRNRRLDWKSRQGTGSDGLFTSFNSLSGTTGKLGYYTYFNYKNGNGFRPNSGFESSNLYAHLDYQLGAGTSVALELTWLDYLARQPGGLTDAQFYENPDFSNRDRNWFDVIWNLAALKFQHRFSYESELSVTLFGLDASRKSIGFRTNRVSQPDISEEPRDLINGNFRNWGSEIRWLKRYYLGDTYSVFLIGSKYYQSDNHATQGPGSATEKPDFDIADHQFPNYPNQSDFHFPNRNVVLFGENIFYLADNLSLTPGFRFEHIDTRSAGQYRRINFDLAGNPIQNDLIREERRFNRHFLLFGLGLSYLPDSDIEFYGNLSQNYRSVTFNDIRIVNPSFQVDPDITDERGFTADAGVRGTINEKLTFNVNGYLLAYNGRLGEVLRAEERENAHGEMVETGRIVRFRGNIGRAVMYGLESLFEWNLVDTFMPEADNWRLNLFLNTALTGSRYLESEIPGVSGNRVEFVPLLNLKSGLIFGYRNLTGSLQYSYLSKQFTDASNARQNRMDNQSGIVGAIPSYDVLDLSLAWTIKPFKLEAGVTNLLDNHYFTRRATGYPGPGIIPSAPRSYYVTLELGLGR